MYAHILSIPDKRPDIRRDGEAGMIADTPDVRQLRPFSRHFPNKKEKKKKGDVTAPAPPE